MRLAFAAFLFASSLIVTLPAGAAAKPEPDPLLGQITRVYLLTMTGGMDQYLANQLTSKHLFEVVTDPKLADAVMTEAIGPAFEARLLELLPPPPPPNAPPPPPRQKGKENEPEAQGLVGGGVPLRTASMGHARGNLFLVELKTRRVIWSIYRLPKNRTSVELDRTSVQVAEDLNRNLGKK